jgi:hypothetical protein
MVIAFGRDTANEGGRQMISRFQPTTNSMRYRQLLAATVLFGAALASVSANATTTVTCAPSKVKAIAQTLNTNRTTTSTTFVDVPATTTNIVQGGNSNSCVIVDFNGLVAAAANTALFVTAVLDDVVGVPDYAQLIHSATTFENRSVSFLFPDVAPGTHTVKMQFHSSNGQIVYINRSTVIIRFVP